MPISRTCHLRRQFGLERSLEPWDWRVSKDSFEVQHCAETVPVKDFNRCTVDLWRPDDGCRLNSVVRY
jgi:hypothetical protein